MYENLVERLNKHSAEHEHHGGITAEAADAIEKLNRIIYLLESDRDAERELRLYAEGKIPRWIPVKEPPKEGEPVFVHIPCRYRKQESIPMIAFWEQGQWKEYESHRLVYNITHWMPLPEPPKEE